MNTKNWSDEDDMKKFEDKTAHLTLAIQIRLEHLHDNIIIMT